MLAQNFKTPADLKISDAEFGALVKVLGMLERGDLKTVEYGPPTGPFDFNMSCSGISSECGTVACIGGWVAVLMGRKGDDIARYVNDQESDGVLAPLYWPDEVGALDATAPQASVALRNYLTHGEPRWDEAMAS